MKWQALREKSLLHKRFKSALIWLSDEYHGSSGAPNHGCTAGGHAMMLKDIQILENAARTAMAGNDDPLPPPSVQRIFKPIHLGLATAVLLGSAYFLFG